MIEETFQDKIVVILARHNAILSSAMVTRLWGDIVGLGWEVAKKLSETKSPSQLGIMRKLGIRRLAQLRRDEPAKFEQIMKELETLLHGTIYTNHPVFPHPQHIPRLLNWTLLT